MAFHYSDGNVSSEHLMNDHYQPDYSQPYVLQSQEAEYELRSNVLVDGGDRFGVSAAVFDKYEELIWMGNQGGHVTSYYGPTMQKYTSFQVHATEEIRDILTVDKGIYLLTKSILRHQIRRGIPKFTHKNLLAWEQEALLYPRICADVCCREWRQEKLTDCVNCGQVSYCSDHPEHLPSSHQRWCKSYALYQKLVLHHQTFGKLMPKLPKKLFENWQIPDNMNEVDTQNSLCSVMDVSSTSQAMVFGDQAGRLHLFSPQHNNEPVFNNFSRATEFADPPPNLPYASFEDNSFSYSSVPLPPLASGSKWFNELPPEFFTNVYRKPKPIDQEVLRTMKMQGPIGYAPNPRTHRRNQMPYIEEDLEDIENPGVDRRNPQQPIPRYYLKTELRFDRNGENCEQENINETGLPGIQSTVPNSYCNPMLQVLYYIPPLKATLLAHTCAKEFCLSCELGFLFRALDSSGGAACRATNFLRAFRTVPEAAALGLILPERTTPRIDVATLVQSWNRFILHQMHAEILETRRKEKELAYLTQRIRLVRPGNKAVQKLLNGEIDEFELDMQFLDPTLAEKKDYDENWHNDTTFLNRPPQAECEELLEAPQTPDIEEPPPPIEDSEISQLFAIARQQINRCMKCNKEEERDTVVLACALQYSAGVGFLELVSASLASRRATPAWCETCARFTPTTQVARILRLPPILAINCGGMTAQEKAFWSRGGQKPTPEVIKRGGSGKPCRYGLHCARPGCRFKHPERPSATPQSNAQDNGCILPHHLNIRLQPDGEVVITDKANATTDLKSDFKRRYQCENYSLHAAVVCVEDNPRNLVAYVKIPDEKGDQRWYLFNDLNIVQVSPEEVVSFSCWWKWPCVLFYSTQRAVGTS
nr:PAN2-PAN3 deadenylation complex catalytic subunit PAN2-like [Danaus plexippus plexippus]